MKHLAPAQKRCAFCSASLNNGDSVCLNCSPTITVSRGLDSHNAEMRDFDATERVGFYPADLYLSAIHAQAHLEEHTSVSLTPIDGPPPEHETSEETLRVGARGKARLSTSIDGPPPEHRTSEETIRVAPRAKELLLRAREQEVANLDDADATILAAHRVSSVPYTQAKVQADQLASGQSQESMVKQPPGRKKRSRRGFLAALHLIADLLLLLLLVGFGFLVYEQNTSSRQVQSQASQQQSQMSQQSSLRQEQIAQERAGQTRQEAFLLVRQYQQEAKSWGMAHLYHDSYDGHTYTLDNGYAQAGVGASINQDLANASTTADFQWVVEEAQNGLFNLQALENDYKDHAPYNQIHATDQRLLTYYGLEQRTVLVVSMVEQVMRVYQNNKLIRAFYVTTGRFERPSLPGVWPILNRLSPTIFVASDPQGSPYWFPNTPINYALLYHTGGFFVHDAPWRATFGPGSQFPHQDASGNTPYNFDGSHGCVNLSESDAAWVYHHTDWNTVILVY